MANVDIICKTQLKLAKQQDINIANACAGACDACYTLDKMLINKLPTNIKWTVIYGDKDNSVTIIGVADISTIINTKRRK